jgi:hypothetical protein
MMSRIHQPLGVATTANTIHAVVPVAPVVPTIAVIGDVDDTILVTVAPPRDRLG